MYAEIPSRKSRWMPEGATVSNFLKGWMQRCLRASPMRTACKPQGIIITTTVRSRGRQGLNTPLLLQPRWCWVASTTAPACMLVSQETGYRVTHNKMSEVWIFFMTSFMIVYKPSLNQKVVIWWAHLSNNPKVSKVIAGKNGFYIYYIWPKHNNFW